MDHDPDKYLNECVAIDEFALQAEYMRLPADYAYWNARYAEVYRFLLRSKMTRDQLQARLHKEYRARLEAQRSSGRVTIAEVDAEVEADPEYLEAKVTEIEADAECKKLQGVMEALRTKREMLISLGAHIRAEMQRDPSVHQRGHVDREVVDARREA
jgi:hypothetical protein